MKSKHLVGVILLFIMLVTTSCKSTYYYIGMSQSEFLAKNKKAVPRKETVEESIYEIGRQPFGKAYVQKFFYFQNGKLVQVDNGERQPDIIIKHN